MSFKSNFNRICREKGTTPTALLISMGVAHSKVAMWNKGSLPKEEMMVRLAHELGCSVMDFFADEDDLPVAPVEPANDDENDILRIYRSLPRRLKHEFMATVYRFEEQNELAGDNGTDQGSAM